MECALASRAVEAAAAEARGESWVCARLFFLHFRFLHLNRGQLVSSGDTCITFGRILVVMMKQEFVQVTCGPFQRHVVFTFMNKTMA